MRYQISVVIQSMCRVFYNVELIDLNIHSNRSEMKGTNDGIAGYVFLQMLSSAAAVSLFSI